MCGLELGIVSLILRTENEEMTTCGSGSQDSKLKEWHLFQQATKDDLCPGPLTLFYKESESKASISLLSLASESKTKTLRPARFL